MVACINPCTFQLNPTEKLLIINIPEMRHCLLGVKLNCMQMGSVEQILTSRLHFADNAIIKLQPVQKLLS